MNGFTADSLHQAASDLAEFNHQPTLGDIVDREKSIIEARHH